MTIFDARGATYDNLAWVHDRSLLSSMTDLISEDTIENAVGVLDLATGTGAILQSLAGRVKELIGVDPSEVMLRQAREKLDGSGVQLLQGTGENIPLSDCSVDLVICRNGLHHMSSPEQAMAEIKRVLRPGGSLCVIEPVAPSVEALGWWSEVILLKDTGRNSTFTHTGPELRGRVLSSGYRFVREAYHTMEFKIEDWLINGNVQRSVSERVIRLFEGATGRVREEMGIHYTDNGVLVANKLTLLLLVHRE